VAAGFVAVVLGVALGRAIAGPEMTTAVLAAADDVRGIDE
jgi:hypothetical protein